MSRLALAIVALVVTAPAAWACTCSGTFSGSPACSQRWLYPAVFVGRVTAIDPPPARANGLMSTVDPLTVHFDVSEAFAGVSQGTVAVTTAMDPVSCGYDFKVGEVYLVYARGSTGAWTVSLCSGTKRTALAQDDLQYLRNVPATSLEGVLATSSMSPITVVVRR